MNGKKVLIDSHVLIWLLYEPEKISPKTKNLLQKAETVLLSPVSLWELTLKFSKGKLAYPPEELVEGAAELNIDRLPLRDEHILAVLNTKLKHKDPFDRMLLAQGQAENCTFVTADSRILRTNYRTFKC